MRCIGSIARPALPVQCAFWVIVCALMARADAPTTQPFHRTEAFILGADISWVPEDEADGAMFFDHGVHKDVFAILKDHGFNYIRLRVFVDPSSPRGYAARRNEAFCDLAHTLAMAKRAHDTGLGLLIDFHYSDTWADPGKQFKPAAWEKMSVDELKKAVHDHTRTVLQALKEQGTTPQMVQIGNEITNGMLWPDGDLKHFDQLAEFIKAGVAGAKEVDPAIKIVLHHDKGRTNSVMRWWLDNLISRGVQFNIIGMSCYQQAHDGDWKTNFDDLAVRYPQYSLMIAEYSGQKRYVNDLIFNAPDQRGIGTFIWEPTRWREAIFDQDGHNAGGGEPANFITPPTTRPTTRPTTMRFSRTHGGRFDANSFMGLYDQMAKNYAAR